MNKHTEIKLARQSIFKQIIDLPGSIKPGSFAIKHNAGHYYNLLIGPIAFATVHWEPDILNAVLPCYWYLLYYI